LQFAAVATGFVAETGGTKMAEKKEQQLSRWDPFADLAFPEWGRFPEFGGLRRWFEEADPGRRLGLSAPVVDITETDDRYQVSAEVPGVKKDDLTLEVQEGVLTLRGEKKQEREDENEKGRRLERVYGAFTRSFSLPADADPDHIEASFKDGVLTVRIPKRPEAKPAQVAIKD
jgi:HSP20 family protein